MTEFLKKYRLALIVAIALPLLVAGVGMWALKDRAVDLQRVPAAVVNLDEGTHMQVDGKDQFVPFGRMLTGALTQPTTLQSQSIELPDGTEKAGFNWQLTTQDDATTGLANGTYAAVVVIPKDFSKKLGQMGNKDAEQANITVNTNDASGMLKTLVGQAVAQVVTSGMNNQFAQQYLSGIYVGFNDISASFKKAADGATKLSDGTGQLATGIKGLNGGVVKLDSGVKQYASGVTAYAKGVDQATKGSHDLATGLGKLTGGADQVASGNEQLATGITKLSDGATQLSGGAQQLHDGIAGTPQKPGLKTGVDTLVAGVAGDGTAENPGIVAGSKQLAQGADRLADGADALANGADGKPGLVAASKQTSEALRNAGTDAPSTPESVLALLQQCESTSQGYCQDLAALVKRYELMRGTINGDKASGITGAAEATEQIADGLQQGLIGDKDQPGLATGLRQLADGADQFADQSPQLVNGVKQLQTGVNGLASGSQKLSSGLDQWATGAKQSADGATKLSSGARQLADGTKKSADGATTFATGMDKLNSGAKDLATGADGLAKGTTDLSKGTGKLQGATDQLHQGTKDLAGGLQQGADKVPTYDKDERSKLAKTSSQAIAVESNRENAANGGATATFPFIAGLALWVGAFGTFLVLPALSRRLMNRAMPMSLVALRTLLPALGIGVLQAALVLGISALAGIKPASVLGVVAVALVASLAFAAVHQMLMTVFGSRIGRIASVVVLVLQVVVLAGILPIESAPPLLQSLNNVMPLSIASQGFTHASLGGAITRTSTVLIELTLTLFVSFAITLVAARNKRVLKVARPEAD